MSQSILAIDDSSDIHQLLKVRLRPDQLELHHSLTAEEGLQKARALLPDLVLLDVDMPNLSGFEVCRMLKADPLTRNIPVIFLTGASNVYNKVEGFELGAVDYVTKPFEAAELRARVRSALRTKRYQDLLSTRAQVDGLTGLWNRAYFDRRMIEELEKSRRQGTALGLLMVDIDHFKRINDEFGHPYGDLIITAVAELLASSIRPSDAACRYGGEEFAIVLPDANHEAVLAVADRIRTGLAKRVFAPNLKPIDVTVSIGAGSTAGVAKLPDREGFVKIVDDALYVAKKTGRDRVCRAAA
jgi:two-component system, cell cycle response regulator